MLKGTSLSYLKNLIYTSFDNEMWTLIAKHKNMFDAYSLDDQYLKQRQLMDFYKEKNESHYKLLITKLFNCRKLPQLYVEEKLKNDFKAKAHKYKQFTTEELSKLAKGL